jgi:hypothetical protein
VERIQTRRPPEIRPFTFYNDGSKSQFLDSDQKSVYTQLMLRKVHFKKLNCFSKFKVIRIKFTPGLGQKPYQFLFRNLYHFGSPGNLFYFAKNKDFIVLNIPHWAKEVIVEVDGDLKEELFEVDIEYFLV